MTSDTTLLCVICGDSTDDARLVTECISCSRTFHLNPFNDKEHKDCGDALIGPTQGVEFWCESCIAVLNAEANANPPDPRAMIDDVAVPADLFPQGRPGATPASTTPASEAPSDAPARTGAPPARRGRTGPAKRYRRIDS